MKKSRYQVWKYEFMLWKKAVDDTIAFYKTEKFIALLINAFSIALSLIALYLLGGEQAFRDQWLTIKAGAIGFVGGIIIYLLVCRLSAPLILYQNEKRKADRFNWNDITVSNKATFDGEEFRGYRIGLENGKSDRCYFAIELKYLELDGELNNYQKQNKSRILVWSSGGSFSQFGIWLNPKDVDISKRIGFWELFQIAENAQGKKYRIVFGEHDESPNSPQKEYAYFSRFAKGELKLHGTYVNRPLA